MIRQDKNRGSGNAGVKTFRPDNILSFPVESTGDTLLEFVASGMPQTSRTTLKSYLRHSQIAVNGVPTSQFDTSLSDGDLVQVNTTREFRTLRNPRLKLVYEDDDILVVNKGYGLLSMGNDRVREGTAYSIVRDYVKWQNPRNKVFIVHRLDQHTSGLMMMARSVTAKERMQHNWNNMVISRTYYCVVEGNVENDRGTVRSYLAENSEHEVYSTEDKEKGKLAVTRYEVIGRGNGYSLLQVNLDTGRKNQIRVHMKDLGHPIAGDRRYGAHTSPIHRLALHAGTLRFVHPMSRRDMNFSTPIPAAFLKMVR